MKTFAGVVVLLAGLFALTVSVACSMPSDACGEGTKDLPITVWTDDRFDDVERAAMVRAMNVWDRETLAKRRDKSPLFINAGLISNKELNKDAAYDDQIITYNVVSEDEKDYFSEFADSQGRLPNGVCVGNDVALGLFRYSAADRAEADYGYDVESLAIHELGHLLGLPHATDRDKASVMWPAAIWIVDENGEPTITEHDVQAFCDLYPCN